LNYTRVNGIPRDHASLGLVRVVGN